MQLYCNLEGDVKQLSKLVRPDEHSFTKEPYSTGVRNEQSACRCGVFLKITVFSQRSYQYLYCCLCPVKKQKLSNDIVYPMLVRRIEECVETVTCGRSDVHSSKPNKVSLNLCCKLRL